MFGIAKVVGLMMVLWLVSCSSQVPQKKEPEVLFDPVVGVVATVHPEAKYVLVRRMRALLKVDESVVYAQGRRGSLTPLEVTGERMGEFWAADYRGDEPAVGDAVFQRDLSNGAMAPWQRKAGEEELTLEEVLGIRPRAQSGEVPEPPRQQGGAMIPYRVEGGEAVAP